MQGSARARILIIGQAPGARTNDRGRPFDDVSGDRLRDWLGLDKDRFYDATRLAIMPMGFCYPGRGSSGDLPPRRACAPLWHPHLLAQLPDIRLTLLVGQYALRYYAPGTPASLTDTVKRWCELLPDYLPLPHPSPRNQAWLKHNRWFETELLPELRRQVQIALI